METDWEGWELYILFEQYIEQIEWYPPTHTHSVPPSSEAAPLPKS